MDQATRDVLRNHIRSFADTPNAQAKRVGTKKTRRGSGGLLVVRDTRIELVTSSVSGKRSPTELIARDMKLVVEVATGIEPVCTALQAVASPLGHTTRGESTRTERMTGFEPATLTLAR